MQLSRELPVSLQLTAYTLLLNVNTENIAKLYNVHTGGGKKQVVPMETMMKKKRRERLAL